MIFFISLYPPFPNTYLSADAGKYNEESNHGHTGLHMFHEAGSPHEATVFDVLIALSI